MFSSNKHISQVGSVLNAKKLALAFWLSASVILSSCQLPLNEPPPQQQAPDTGFGETTRCLDGVLPVMERFLKGTARPNETKATWTCFRSAIGLFQKSTRGRFQDRFTDKELRNFFENYFLDSKASVNDRLLTEIFRLKQLLVGGDIDSMTRTEMAKLMDVADKLGDISERLVPYMRVFSFNWSPTGFRNLEDDFRYFESANLEIQRAAREIGLIIENNGLGYEIRNFVVLLEEIASLYKTRWTWLNDLREVMPLIEKLKETLTGGRADYVSHLEWRKFTLLGSRGFIQYLRYYYFVQETEGLSSGSELFYIARSIDDLFSFLGDMVAEKPEGLLTKAELMQIFSRVTAIFPDFKVSEKLLDEFMKIKQLFFGGSLDNWRKADFDNARSKVEAFRSLTERLLVYWVIYSFQWDPQELEPEEGVEYLRTAEVNISEFGRRLGQIMETDYDLNDLKAFVDEWASLYPSQEVPGQSPIQDLVGQYLPVVVSFKNMVLTDSGSVVSKARWSELLQPTADLFGRYLHWFYYVGRSETVFSGFGLTSLDTFVSDTLNYLRKLVSRKPANPVQWIRFSETDALIESLVNAKIIPDTLGADALKQIVRVVFQKILIPPEQRLMPHPPEGIGHLSLDYMDEEFTVWYNSQKFVESTFSRMPEGSQLAKAELLRLLGLEPPSVGTREFQMMFNTPVVLAFDDLDRTVLFKEQYGYSQKTLNYANLIRHAVRLVIRSYAGEIERINTYKGVSEAEAVALFEDVKPLVVQLGLVHPDEVNFPKSRFRDANLFTPRADGDNLMSFQEGVDLAFLIWSGLSTDTLLYKTLEDRCRVQKESPHMLDWKVPVTCLAEVYRTEVDTAMSHMPQFLEFKRSLNPQEFERVMFNLLKAAGYVPDDTGLANISSVALFPHVTQYVEVIMQRYDFNHNGLLETFESLETFKVYEPILKQVSGIDDRKQLEGLFTWILKKGKPPESILEKIDFALRWVNMDRTKWNVRADRERLAQILGFIADAMNGSTKVKNPNDLDEPSEESPFKDVPDSDLKQFCDRRTIHTRPAKLRAECRRRGLL